MSCFPYMAHSNSQSVDFVFCSDSHLWLISWLVSWPLIVYEYRRTVAYVLMPKLEVLYSTVALDLWIWFLLSCVHFSCYIIYWPFSNEPWTSNPKNMLSYTHIDDSVTSWNSFGSQILHSLGAMSYVFWTSSESWWLRYLDPFEPSALGLTAYEPNRGCKTKTSSDTWNEEKCHFVWPQTW